MPEHKKVSAAELQASLKGADYPADRGDLIECARSNEATEPVLNFLERIPDKKYNTPIDVSQELGEASSDQDMAA